MTTITTRVSKGSPLTIEELDDNFINLSTDIVALQANAQAQQESIAELQVSGNIAATNANVTAANARIATLDANLGTATTNITALQANAGTQQTTINTLTANAATQSGDIATLFANAATQSQDIAAVNAELDSVEAWANINLNLYTNTNVAAYLPGYGGNILVNTVTANSVAIATTAGQTPTVGKLVWDSGSGTLAYQYAGGNVVNYIGRQLNSLVYNSEATTLNKGEVVYIFGAQGQRPSVKRAQANSDTTSARTLGVVAESIVAGAEGLVTIAGEVADIDTSAFTEGAILYLSGTTPGAITQTKPQAPTHLVYVGVCLKSNASSGRIKVTVQNGYELDEIHDVQIINRQNNDFLVYNGTANVWQNQTPSQVRANLSLATVATTGSYTDLSNKPTIPDSILDLGITDGTNGQVLTTNGAGGFSFTTVSAGSSYGNTQVAAYLPTYTGSLAGSSSITDLYANAATQATEISSLWSNAASQATTLTAKADTASLAAVATSGSYTDLSNRPTIPGQDSAGANQVVYKNGSNVATGSSGLTYNGTDLSVAGVVKSTYSSGDEGGEIQLALATTNTTLSSGVVIDINQNRLRFFESGGTNRGAYIDLTAAGTGVGSNLLAGGSSSSFTGDLSGSVFYDSVNERIIANAYPLSTGDTTVPGNGTSRFITHNPTYTSGVLQPPPLANATVGGTGIVAISSQTVGMIQSANIAFQSGYGFGAQNRDTVNFLSQTTVTPVTANTMANQDRIRGGVFSLDLNLAGQTYGTMSSTSQNATTVAAVNGFVNLNGRGNVSSISGGTYGSFITPAANQTANIQYSTSLISFLTLSGTAGTSGKANLVYHRALAPFIAGMTANLTVQNAVGLHTYSGWAGTGTVGTSGNPTTGRFALLNEDVNTTIRTSGPVIVSNASATFSGNVECSSVFNGGFLKFASYTAAGLTAYVGTTGQVASVSDQGGKLAYWDTTNTRWSYVHDNSAV